jgi:hypothetical protein
MPTMHPVGPQADSLLPMIIGVTGHRDIRADAVLPVKHAVTAFFTQLRRQLPNTPFVLLSPLAEGADRLVADVFLESLRPGDRLVAPMPFPLEEYRRDFATLQSTAEFNRLLGIAQMVQLPLLPGTVLDDVQAGGHARDLQYEQVGLTIARSAHILLALWNGLEAGSTGGTGEIVRYRLDGIPAAAWARQIHLDPPEVGPVQHVLTPRVNDIGVDSPGTSRLLVPAQWRGAAAGVDHLESLQVVENFNANARAFLARYKSKCEDARTSIWSQTDNAPVLRPAEDHIRNVYAVADAMAVHYQAWSRRVTKWLLFAGVAVIATGGIYADFAPGAFMAFIYLLCLMTGGILLWVDQRQGSQRKHLNYRALAEGLRVQFFWRVGGIRQSVTDSYMRVQREALHGIRQTLRFADLDIGDSTLDANEWTRRLRAVHADWITSQRRYFIGPPRGVASHSGNDYARLTLLKAIALRLGAFVLVAVAVAHLSTAVDAPMLAPGVQRLLDATGSRMGQDIIGKALTVGSLFLAIAAAIAAYVEIQGLQEHAREAQKMGELYLRAEMRLHDSIAQAAAATTAAARHMHIKEARAIIHEIGLEALAENGEWFLLHRDRPHEFTPG